MNTTQIAQLATIAGAGSVLVLVMQYLKGLLEVWIPPSNKMHDFILRTVLIALAVIGTMIKTWLTIPGVFTRQVTYDSFITGLAVAAWAFAHYHGVSALDPNNPSSSASTDNSNGSHGGSSPSSSLSYPADSQPIPPQETGFLPYNSSSQVTSTLPQPPNSFSQRIDLPFHITEVPSQTFSVPTQVVNIPSVLRVAPIGSSESTPPTERLLPIQPIQPTQPTQPTQPIQPTEKPQTQMQSGHLISLEADRLRKTAGWDVVEGKYIGPKVMPSISSETSSEAQPTIPPVALEIGSAAQSS